MEVGDDSDSDGAGDNSPREDSTREGDTLDEDQATSSKTAKKTKGRVKIKMEFIDNKLRRYTTFSKRKTGIMKKAYELSTLTGTQVMLLVASETGHVYTFATRKLQPMITSEEGKSLIQTCLNSPDPPNTSTSNQQADQRMSATGFEEPDLTCNLAPSSSSAPTHPAFSTEEIPRETSFKMDYLSSHSKIMPPVFPSTSAYDPRNLFLDQGPSSPQSSPRERRRYPSHFGTQTGYYQRARESKDASPTHRDLHGRQTRDRSPLLSRSHSDHEPRHMILGHESPTSYRIVQDRSHSPKYHTIAPRVTGEHRRGDAQERKPSPSPTSHSSSAGVVYREIGAIPHGTPIALAPLPGGNQTYVKLATLPPSRSSPHSGSRSPARSPRRSSSPQDERGGVRYAPLGRLEARTHDLRVNRESPSPDRRERTASGSPPPSSILAHSFMMPPNFILPVAHIPTSSAGASQAAFVYPPPGVPASGGTFAVITSSSGAASSQSSHTSAEPAQYFVNIPGLTNTSSSASDQTATSTPQQYIAFQLPVNTSSPNLAQQGKSKAPTRK